MKGTAMTADKLPARATTSELRVILEKEAPPAISLTMIDRHIQKASLKKDKRGRVDVRAFLSYYIEARQRDNKNIRVTNPDGTMNPKYLKIGLECQLLKLKLDEAKNMLVPVEEHQAALREMAVWVKDCMAMFISRVKVRTGNAKVLADAEQLRDDVFQKMREKVSQ